MVSWNYQNITRFDQGMIRSWQSLKWWKNAGDSDEGDGEVEYDKWQSSWSLKENMTNF